MRSFWCEKINLNIASLVREDHSNDDGAFSNEDAQECTGTSSKGPSDKSHPNDQVVESPLKKNKKNQKVKIPIAKRVFASIKTRVADKSWSAKHGQGKVK
jgi:hypothetical protein